METLIFLYFSFSIYSMQYRYIDLIYIIPKLFINCNHMPIQGLIFQLRLDFFQLPSMSSDVVKACHIFTEEGPRLLSVYKERSRVLTERFGPCGLAVVRCSELCCFIPD